MSIELHPKEVCMYRMQKMSLAVAAENFVGGDVIAFGALVVAVWQKLRDESDVQMAKLCKTWKKTVNTYSDIGELLSDSLNNAAMIRKDMEWYILPYQITAYIYSS